LPSGRGRKRQKRRNTGFGIKKEGNPMNIEDQIKTLNNKINSLQNDITIIKIRDNQILQMLKKINEKINKNG
jgi:hypothetical protein